MHASAQNSALREEITGFDWYHTLELAPGVETPGWFDLRDVVADIPFPESFAGKRCLDIGTFDGFWAFEMERRGAREVLAIDILDPHRWDWPLGSTDEAINAIGKRKAQGQGFKIAHRELGSSVVRHELSVYDLSPESLGEFDVVYLGSILLHLRDPVRALERIRSICSGTLISVDAIDFVLSIVHPRKPVAMLDGRGRPWWWRMNIAGLRRLVEVGGFDVTEGPSRLYMPSGRGQRPPRDLRLLRVREGREAWAFTRVGDPHAVVAATPRSV